MWLRPSKEKKSSNPLAIRDAMKRLDINERFEFQDSSENFWRFAYESIGGEEGWYAWVRHPNNTDYYCVGRISESELAKKVESNPPLNDDDLIDLELWLIHGGLNQYQPRKRRGRKPKEIKD